MINIPRSMLPSIFNPKSSSKVVTPEFATVTFKKLHMREWNADSIDYLTWKHGDIWKITDADRVHIGYSVVCPVESVPTVRHREFLLFKTIPINIWVMDKNGKPITSPCIVSPTCGLVASIKNGEWTRGC